MTRDEIMALPTTELEARVERALFDSRHIFGQPHDLAHVEAAIVRKGLQVYYARELCRLLGIDPEGDRLNCASQLVALQLAFQHAPAETKLRAALLAVHQEDVIARAAARELGGDDAR